MNICTYDNPDTMRRECWQDGKPICSYSGDLFLRKETIPSEHLFFGANIGRWKAGQLIGDKKAMEQEQVTNDVIEILEQGCILVNDADTVISTDAVCAIEIDLTSKHVDLWNHFSQSGGKDDGLIGIRLGKTMHTMHHDPDTESPTEISFPKHNQKDGWEVFAIDGSKYTVKVCLVNRRAK